jgi:hypothetical protein
MTKLAALVSLLCCLLFSCKKPAGEGGQASIRGKVIVYDYNSSLTVLKGVYPAYDVDVYIIYGDDVSYGDKVKTGPDGMFEFKYLRKGKYKVYVYSKVLSQSNPAPEDEAIIKEVTISKRKGAVDAPDITIIS